HATTSVAEPRAARLPRPAPCVIPDWLPKIRHVDHRDHMKFSTLALDYDGTIAVDGVFDPDVRRAIGAARRRGVVVSLVTGRRLDDLRRAAGDVTCFDVAVPKTAASSTSLPAGATSRSAVRRG